MTHCGHGNVMEKMEEQMQIVQQMSKKMVCVNHLMQPIVHNQQRQPQLAVM